MDWLGTARLNTWPNQSGPDVETANAPFGESYAQTGATDREFAGMAQQQVTTGPYPLYDAMFRNYNPIWGRWIQPDPAGLAAANPADPQSWNRYAYALNNPVGYGSGLGSLSPVSIAATTASSYAGPTSVTMYSGPTVDVQALSDASEENAMGVRTTLRAGADRPLQLNLRRRYYGGEWNPVRHESGRFVRVCGHVRRVVRVAARIVSERGDDIRWRRLQFRGRLHGRRRRLP